jgi:hypothetical protein
MNKNQDPDPGSGINNPDHISESLETTVWVKNTKNSLLWIFLTLDPGSGTGMEKFEPVINIPDPQHCLLAMTRQ